MLRSAQLAVSTVPKATTKTSSVAAGLPGTVLAAPLAGPDGDVQAGEALQRVLLAATIDGLAVSYLSQLIEVPDARAAVHHLLGTLRPPHAVLRIGHGWPTPRVPRRAVSDMLLGPPAATGRS